MNEQIEKNHCVSYEAKTAKNKWENDDILRALYRVLLVNLFTERYISSVISYKYLNKLIR